MNQMSLRSMAGIVFYKTKELARIRELYSAIPGMEVWLEQAECVIFKHENLLVGFCQRETVDTQALLTFVFDSREKVDAMVSWCKKQGLPILAPPKDNPRYRIYHFFAKDIEDRMIEFQYFWDTMKPIC